MKQLIKRTINDKILWISVICAILSLFLGTPHFSEINWHTILSLLSLMLCVQLLNSFSILDYLSNILLKYSSTKRQTVQYLTLLAFIGSMFLTNDVAILTLIPMFINIVQKQHFSFAFPATLIVMAANLGSAFTPFGNPQNLFLISNYKLAAITFFRLSSPLMIVSLLLLLSLTFFIKPSKTDNYTARKVIVQPIFVIISIGTLCFILLGIFSILPISFVVIGSLLIALFTKPQTIFKVDYALLLTFVCFFLIVSSLKSNSLLTQFIHTLTQTTTSTYLIGIISSQFISNVPATILLSGFTNNVNALFLSVNIGGLGTIIASLANLLALKQIALFLDKAQVWHFFKVFSFINAFCLLILGLVGLLLL